VTVAREVISLGAVHVTVLPPTPDCPHTSVLVPVHAAGVDNGVPEVHAPQETVLKEPAVASAKPPLTPLLYENVTVLAAVKLVALVDTRSLASIGVVPIIVAAENISCPFDPPA
jgi:hypothetical protein